MKALKRFVAEYWQDPETEEIKEAFTNYRDLGHFEMLLEKHLEKLIEQKLPKRWIDRRAQIILRPHWPAIRVVREFEKNWRQMVRRMV